MRLSNRLLSFSFVKAHPLRLTLRQVVDSASRLVGHCPIRLQFPALQKCHASSSTRRKLHRLVPGRGKHPPTEDSLELHPSKPRLLSVKEAPQIYPGEEPTALHAVPFLP